MKFHAAAMCVFAMFGLGVWMHPGGHVGNNAPFLMNFMTISAAPLAMYYVACGLWLLGRLSVASLGAVLQFGGRQ